MDERQAAAALLALISADIEGDYDEIVLVTTMLEGVADCAISTFGASGERGLEVPESAWDILAALRHDMATPRGGAWFAAKFVWTPSSDFRATFDYDSRPQWPMGVDPESEREMIIEDFETFPRSPEATPQWLSDIINSAK